MTSSPDLTPIAPRTLSDVAAERLRASIRHGVLRPGARLIERDLAERLGMSRIPIREAMQRLVEEGLVKKTPHRGTFVAAPSHCEIGEISSLRVVLERFVVERVVVRWQPDHEARLHQIVDAMRRAATESAFQQMYEQDFLFHYTLWEIADHSILLEVVSGLRSRISRFLYEAASAMPATQLDAYIALHNDLIEVLKRGNVAAAQQAITDHILQSTERILTFHGGA